MSPPCGSLRQLRHVRRPRRDDRGRRRARARAAARGGAARAGGDAAAVTENRADPDALALVWIGQPDVATLRAASRAGIPIVGAHRGREPSLRARHEPRPRRRRAAGCRCRRSRRRSPARSARPARALPHGCRCCARRWSRALARQNDDPRRRDRRRPGSLPGPDFPTLTLNQSLLVVRTALASRTEGRAPRRSCRSSPASPSQASRARQLARKLDSLPVQRSLLRARDRSRRHCGRRCGAAPPLCGRVAGAVRPRS